MESCILPCSFQSAGEVHIRWIQLRATQIPVLSFYSDQDQVRLHDRRFRGRSALFRDQISRGNASLLLTGVKVQDEGRYECFTESSGAKNHSFISLTVDGTRITQWCKNPRHSHNICFLWVLLFFFFLQLQSVKSKLSRWETESAAAQRESIPTLSTAGPLKRRPTQASRAPSESAGPKNSFTTSTAPWRSLKTFHTWSTAAASAPGETRGRSLCFDQVRHSPCCTIFRYVIPYVLHLMRFCLKHFSVARLRFYQRAGSWSNHQLLGLEPRRDEARLEVQPQSDPSEQKQDRRRPQRVGGLEETREGRVRVGEPHLEGFILKTGGTLHLWAQ